MKILVGSKDNQFIESLRVKLEPNYGFSSAGNGRQVFNLLKNAYDVILLEEGLEYVDTYQLVEDIKKNYNIPVLLISSIDSTENKLKAFKAGFNDYYLLSDDVDIIVYKINNYFRLFSSKMITVGAISIDVEARQVYVDSNPITLTLKEYELLQYLILNQGKVVSRKRLMEDVWQYHALDDLRTIDTHVKRIRKELGVHRNYITTLRKVGYKFEVKDE